MQFLIRFLSRWSPRLSNKAFLNALAAYDAGDHIEAFEEFEELAKRGNASAQGMLGRMYHLGEGVTLNMEEGTRWIQLAADRGIPQAQFNLGVIYENGAGIPQDISEAVRWYRLAAQWGSAEAQINLACCFQDGQGVDRDASLAAWWISLAAKQGDVDAQINLGNRYLHGIGIVNDVFEAFIWFERAARTGRSDALQFREAAIREMTENQVKNAERLSYSDDWTPESARDSALRIFSAAARQNIETLRQTLGDERFKELKTIDRSLPRVGEIILSETHGFRPATIADNIDDLLVVLDRKIDSNLNEIDETAATQMPGLLAIPILSFIRRIDDLLDIDAVLGQETVVLTDHLLEFHLALIGVLESRIDEETMTMLLKRFTLRNALRSSTLAQYAKLHKVPLPLSPW